MTDAEGSLRDGELQIAESRYRSALFHGWMAMGALEIADGRLPEARDAFRQASTSSMVPHAALRSLAVVHLQMAQPGEAVDILTRLASSSSRDISMRRLLAQALVANGQSDAAVQELEHARAESPDDLELAFDLASGYLRLKKLDAAQQIFTALTKARPIPQTHVLIGRTYRDFGAYEQARAALRAALTMNPRVRRAHYYLGTTAVMADGMDGLAAAVSEFQQELKLAAADPATTVRLGIVLVESRRHAEALPVLQRAIALDAASADAFHYLGRGQLALGRPAEAAVSLRRALELSPLAADTTRLGSIHYQLGVALRALGVLDEAEQQFAEAQRFAVQRASTARDQLARYLTDAGDPQDPGMRAALPAGISSLPPLSPPERAKLKAGVRLALARAYFNLGVMQAQQERFPRAAEFFERAGAIDPNFPQVQYSIAVAFFNAGQYDKAVAPLSHAHAADPANVDLRRMLAMAWINTGAYEKAGALLADDPQRESNPSLQYVYGLSLVRTNRAKEAQAIFARLLTEHGDTPEINVVLGQAHAQQGDYDAAIQALRRALQLKADVAEANGALGFIYLKQGRLAEAAAALRAEIAAHPGDLIAKHTLATVLELDGQPAEAVSLLRSVLKARPEASDSRYLLGKILLAQGAPLEAVEHLEAAVRQAPEDANIHYQLGQAYQKLGRTELAQKQFALFQQLKDARRVK